MSDSDSIYGSQSSFNLGMKKDSVKYKQPKTDKMYKQKNAIKTGFIIPPKTYQSITTLLI